MSDLYKQLIQPIEHLGSTDHVTAAQLRNCLGKLCEWSRYYQDLLEAIEQFNGLGSDDPKPEPSGSAIGDDEVPETFPDGLSEEALVATEGSADEATE